MNRISGVAINIDGTYVQTKPETAEEIARKLQIVKDSGFEYIDLSFGNLIFDYDQKWMDAELEALKRVRLKPVQSHAPILGKILMENGKLVYRMTEREEIGLKNIFTVLHQRGCDLVIFHPHTFYPDKWGDEYLEAHKQLNLEFFRKAGEYAKPYGIRIAVETMVELGDYRHYCAKVSELKELLAELDPETFGYCIDTGHVLMHKYLPQDVVRELGDRLIAFHIQDNNGFTDQHNLPPFGAIDWKEFCRAVKEENFRGYLTYEVNGGGKVALLPPYLQTALYSYAKTFGQWLNEMIEE